MQASRGVAVGKDPEPVLGVAACLHTIFRRNSSERAAQTATGAGVGSLYNLGTCDAHLHRTMLWQSHYSAAGLRAHAVSGASHWSGKQHRPQRKAQARSRPASCSSAPVGSYSNTVQSIHYSCTTAVLTCTCSTRDPYRRYR